MVFGAVVHWVCAAPPQPGQEQRIPAILQTDAATEAPAAHRILFRYGLHTCCRGTMNPFTACVSFLHKMAVMLNEERVCLFFCVFVCRKCSASGCSGCTSITDYPNLHAAQCSGVGVLGGIALPALLHR